MLTEAQTTNDFSAAAQNEKLPNDHEIAERVLRIRSGWDLNERIARREEADRRFRELCESLGDIASAA